MLILALGLMTIVTASSFAAVPFFTSSTVNIVPVNAQSGLAGSVLFTALIGGTVTQGEIIQTTYQAPISYIGQIAVIFRLGGVDYTFSQGANPYGTALTNGSVPGVTVTVNSDIMIPANTITIAYGADVAFASGDQIQINGVRLNTTGFATLGGTTTVFLTNTTGQATVINPLLTVATFAEPLAKPVVTGTLSWDADGTINNNMVTVTVKELFTNAFDTRGAGNNATRVQLELSNIPAGVSFGGINTITGSAGVTAAIIGTPTAGNILIGVSVQDPNDIDYVDVGIYFNVSNASLLPVTPGNIGVRAKLVDPWTTAYPITLRLRFIERWVSADGGIGWQVSAITSYLFSTYNEASKFIGGTAYQFDTGFAVVNTSGSGIFSPDWWWFQSAQPGTITACLYPMAGGANSPYCFTTSATKKPGRGLDANGMLGPKQTWTVLLSELLPQTTIGATEFRGFVTFACNFRGAQGINFIADGEFDTTAQGYPMWSTDNFYNLQWWTMVP